MKNSLNLNFNGSYQLLKWVVKKYKNELPYGGEILKFSGSLPYSKNMSNNWNLYGVPVRVWNVLNKDITIAYLMGNIKGKDLKTLKELKREFEEETE